MSPDYDLPLSASLLEANLLDGWRVIHINHDLADINSLNRLLELAGANVHFLPIPYRKRVDASALENGSNGQHPWRARYLDVVREELGPLLEVCDLGRTVVVEDGAYYAELAASGRVGVAAFTVEQTTSGTRRLARFRREGVLATTAYACASATVKLRVESQFLGIRIPEDISGLMAMMGRFLPGIRVAVIGYGIVGRAVAFRLRSAYRCEVVVIEADGQVANTARDEGFETYPRVSEMIEPVSLVIGATGVSACGYEDLRAVTALGGGVTPVLASASSDVVEFGPALIRARGVGWLQEATMMPWGHRLTGDASQVDVIADGLPVNFFQPGAQSLSAAVADLVNYRIVEALIDGTRGESSGRDVITWGGSAEGGIWEEDETLLSAFVQRHGLGLDNRQSSVAMLTSLGLYSEHPQETHLRQALL